MNIEKYIKSGVLEQYVLGLSSPRERAEVEQLAEKYTEINDYICELQESVAQYAEMQSVAPPPHLKKRILRAIDEEEQNSNHHQPLRSVSVMSKWWNWGAGIAALMILTLSVLCYMLYQNQIKAQQDLALLSTQIKHLQTDYQQLEKSKENIMQRYVVLKDLGTKHIPLHGSDHAPQAQVMVYWNPDHSKGYLNIINIPEPPHGHQYQMWADVNGKHMDMGVLEVNEDGNILHTLPYIDNSRGFVITLEKEGGSDHPTVEQMYVHGEIL